MKRRAAIVLVPLFLACGGEPPPMPTPPTAPTQPAPPPGPSPVATPVASAAPAWDAGAYRAAIDEGLGAFFAAYPQQATRAGEHAFDDQLPDLTEAAQLRVAADFRARAEGLRTIAKNVPATADPKDAGTDRPALDAQLLADRLEDRAYDLDTVRSAERDPSDVLSAIGTGIVTLIDHDYAPKHDRMNALATRLGKTTALLAQARARLKSPSRAALENLAIVGKGLPAMLRGPSVAEWQKGLDADKPLGERLAKGAKDAAAAIDAYVKDVTTAFPLAKAKDEPIGAERWATLARLHEGVTETPAAVRKMGEDEIARLNTELDALIAGQPQGKAGKPETRAAFFARIEKDTPKMDGVLDEYRAAEKRVETWMKGHAVVGVPWEKVELIVAPSPPHMRGISFASMNAAGILEPKISDARMQVTEPDPSMPADRRAALLRFHALGAIDVVSVHEAIPGHYLQSLIIRGVPSKVRKLTWAATFSEGWAHYCEQMALENGFGEGDSRMRAYYLRMALQRAARVVVDVAENDGSMTVAQGAKFLEGNALLAPQAAQIEARRAVVWPANMFTYTYGKRKILAMRDAVKAKEGAAFDLRKFHDRLLAVGAMPVTTAGEVAFGDEIR